MDDSFDKLISDLPEPFDTGRAARTLDALAEDEPRYIPPASVRALLESVSGNSPFLARLILREGAFLKALIEKGPVAALAETESFVATAVSAADMPSAMAILRQAK